MPELGFGLMRLPLDGEDIDIESVKRMADCFLESGSKYFDTAHLYHGGKSESVVKKALTERHTRDSFEVATKMTLACLDSKDDIGKVFADQLNATGLDYFDNYLLHAVDGGKLQKLEEFGLWDFLFSLKKKGLARRIGFSFHDTADILEKILSKYASELDFVQLQINYADWDSPCVQSRLNHLCARKYKLGVKVMEPVKGGMLAGLPPEIEKIFKKNAPDQSLASWALRFAGSQDGVETVLSGMSDMRQTIENIAVFHPFKPLDKSEKDTLDTAVKAMGKVPLEQCTRCGYCTTSCPTGMPIPNLMAVLNSKRVFGISDSVRNSFNWYARKSKPSDCVACGKCELACPQHLHIIKCLEELKETFEK